jgi:hypothetical protein
MNRRADQYTAGVMARTQTTDAKASEHWNEEPHEGNYAGAEEFLSLLMSAAEARRLVGRLRAAPTIQRKAKDLLRASGSVVLRSDDPRVAKDLDKFKKAVRLSPVLLVRGRITARAPLIIADGYHRICATYHLDPDTQIPCRIVDLPD